MTRFRERYRTEIKYLGLTALALAGMVVLSASGVLDAFEADLVLFMDELVEWGWLGMFIIAYISNLTLVMALPYGLPLFTLVFYSQSASDALTLGFAAGLGAGLGAATAFVAARGLLAQVQDPGKSVLFRMINTCTTRWPRSVPALVWVSSATPLPEGVVTTSLAMVRYSLSAIVFLVLSGKIVGNLVMSQLYFHATDYFSGRLNEDLHFTWTSILIVLFVLIIAYQIEKTLVMRDVRVKADPAKPRYG